MAAAFVWFQQPTLLTLSLKNSAGLFLLFQWGFFPVTEHTDSKCAKGSSPAFFALSKTPDSGFVSMCPESCDFVLYSGDLKGRVSEKLKME